MNKWIKLVLCGLVPMVVGYFVNFLFYIPMPIFLMNVVFMVLWGYFCYRVAEPAGGRIVQALALSFVGFVMLVLNLYFILVNGAYPMNILGTLCQSYFLPFLTAAVTIENLFYSFGNVISTRTMAPAFACAWVLSLMIALAGVHLKHKNTKG